MRTNKIWQLCPSVQTTSGKRHLAGVVGTFLAAGHENVVPKPCAKRQFCCNTVTCKTKNSLF